MCIFDCVYLLCLTFLPCFIQILPPAAQPCLLDQSFAKAMHLSRHLFIPKLTSFPKTICLAKSILRLIRKALPLISLTDAECDDGRAAVMVQPHPSKVTAEQLWSSAQFRLSVALEWQKIITLALRNVAEIYVNWGEPKKTGANQKK